MIGNSFLLQTLRIDTSLMYCLLLLSREPLVIRLISIVLNGGISPVALDAISIKPPQIEVSHNTLLSMIDLSKNRLSKHAPLNETM